MWQFFQYPGVISCFPCPGYIKVLEKGKKIYVRGWSCFHNKNEAGGSWSEQPVNWTVWLIVIQPGYSPQLLRKSSLFWGIHTGRLTCLSNVFFCGGGKL